MSVASCIMGSMENNKIDVYVRRIDEDGNEVDDEMIDVIPYLRGLSPKEQVKVSNRDYSHINALLVADGLDSSSEIVPDSSEQLAMIHYMGRLNARGIG